MIGFEFHGGDGADVLRLSTVGLLVEEGIVWCDDGGDGNDVIDARLDFDSNSRGMVDVKVMGSAGDDDMTLSISGMGDPGLHTALVDGGEPQRSRCPASPTTGTSLPESAQCSSPNFHHCPSCRSFFEHFELRPGS